MTDTWYPEKEQGEANDLSKGGLLSDFHSMALSTRHLTSISSLLSPFKISFLSRHSSKKPRRLTPTSYLDGLRGCAAICVILYHYQDNYFPELTHGWLAGIDPSDPSSYENNTRTGYVRLPIIRVLFSGRLMVHIFFIISGYVLSHRALGIARTQQWGKLLQSLSSSVFRRWLRLMIPTIISFILSLTIVRAQIVSPLYTDWQNPYPIILPGETAPVRQVISRLHLPAYQESFALQIKEWKDDVLLTIDPFRIGAIRFPSYNSPLWTMQVEWMGSMIIFVTVLGLAMVRPVFRMAFLVCLIIWCIYTVRWSCSLFLEGILLADLSYVRAGHRFSSPPPTLPISNIDTTTSVTESPSQAETEKEGSRPITTTTSINTPDSTPISKTLLVRDIILLLFALWLGTFPESSGGSTPGYRTISLYIPAAWMGDPVPYYVQYGAMLFVTTLEFSHKGIVREVFNTRFAQYLGDVSLSIYMLHLLVEVTFANWSVQACIRVLGGHSHWGLGFFVAMALTTGLTFWAGDVFWRLVDTRSVRFARWVSTVAFVEERSEGR